MDAVLFVDRQEGKSGGLTANGDDIGHEISAATGTVSITGLCGIFAVRLVGRR